MDTAAYWAASVFKPRWRSSTSGSELSFDDMLQTSLIRIAAWREYHGHEGKALGEWVGSVVVKNAKGKGHILQATRQVLR